MTSVQIEIPRGFRVVGRVMDARTTLAVSGATVRDGEYGRQVHTDNEGRFVLAHVHPKQHSRAVVIADGYAQMEEYITSMASGAASGELEAADLEVLLIRGRTLHGWTLDERGDALEGVVVTAVGRDFERSDGSERRDCVQAVSGSGGRFTLPDLRPDMAHLVFFQHPMRAMGMVELSESYMREGREDLGAYRLTEGAIVSGIVRSSDNSAVVGCDVVLLPVIRTEDESLSAIAEWFMTRRVGVIAGERFVFPYTGPGAYRVNAEMARSSKATCAEFRVVAGQSQVSVALSF
jgi:hypothetical protein